MSTVSHDTFTLERTYPATPERVFAAWASSEAKGQWFGDDDEFEMDGAFCVVLCVDVVVPCWLVCVLLCLCG